MFATLEMVDKEGKTRLGGEWSHCTKEYKSKNRLLKYGFVNSFFSRKAQEIEWVAAVKITLYPSKEAYLNYYDTAPREIINVNLCKGI